MADTVWSSMDPQQQLKDISRLDYEDYRSEASDRLKIMEAVGLGLLKSLFLMNAGAIIGLFTFIGNVGVKSIGVDPRALWYAFAWFVGGLVLAVVSNACGYFMQNFFYQATLDQAWQSQASSLGFAREPQHMRPFTIGNRWEAGAVVCAVSSLILFIIGAAVALAGVLAST